MEKFETDLLAELVGQKHDLLVQLRELSRRQTSVIGDGDLSKLLALLAAKQKLLNGLQGVERKLDPFRSQDPDRRQWRSPAERRSCRELAQRCETLLKEIMLMEKQCESDLVHRRDEAASRLQGIHSASEARSAYADSRPVRRGLDLASEE